MPCSTEDSFLNETGRVFRISPGIRAASLPNPAAIPFLFVFFLAVFCIQSEAVYADVVYYTSGENEKGLVVEEHKDRIVFSTEGGEKVIFRNKIDEVFFDDPERNCLYLGKQALDAGDFSMARGFFKKALQMNPHFQEAEDALHRLEDVWQKRIPPSADVDTVALLKSRWGLTLRETGEAPLVQMIAEDSFADRTGLLSGDLLMSAWGDSLAFRPMKEVAEAIVGPPNSILKLTFRRTLLLPGNASQSHWPGMQVDVEPLGLTVIALDPSGSAHAVGIKTGDRIVMIDGRSTRYYPLGQTQKTIRQGQKKGITLIIERDLLIKRI